MLRDKNSSVRKDSALRMRTNYMFAYRAGILSAFILFLLCTHLFLPISIDTNVAEGAALPSTTELAINTDYSSANLDFTTISSTGTFATSSSSDVAKFTVSTNNYTGYTLTLAGNDDTGQLVNNNATETVNNTTRTAALDTIVTSGIESSSFSTNEWGYLPSKYNSEVNTTKYYSAPTTSDADTLDVTNAANSTANEYTIGLGAKVDYSKPAGTYTNTFILAAVGNPITYTINYLDNTGDTTVDNMPNAQASTTTATSITLAPYGSTTPDPADVPTRTDYRFLGWCDVATTNDGKDCSGNMLQTGDTISIDQTSTNVTNLYAVWKSTIINYIQNWASCSTLNTGDTITLTDKRDGEEYLVGKLADGNCWLLDNMRLDLTAVDLDNQDKTGLVGNTNADATTLGYLKNGGGASPNPASRVVAKTTTGGSWSDSYNLPYIATSGTDNGGWTKDTVASVKYGAGSGKIGVYYNYCAASAGSYCYDETSAYGEATQDICPSGWKIPSGVQTVKGSYYYLYTNNPDGYGSNANNFKNALSTSVTGNFFNSSQNNLGWGFFWSSSRKAGVIRDMIVLGITSSSVSPEYTMGRTTGASVRCIHKGDVEAEIEGLTMQEIGSLSTSDYNDLLGSMEEGKAYTTSDVRDGEQYKIAKLKDGNIWMLDNMRLDLTSVSLATLKGNTNATDQSLTYLKNGGGSSPYPASGVVAKTSSGGSWSDSYNLPYIATGYKDTITTNYGSGSGKIGVYYNYCAASAGSYCYAGYLGEGNASQDICPTGWKMPSDNANAAIKGSYYYLFNISYNGNYGSFRNALSTPFSGSFYTGSARYQGSYGYFWSSTFKDTNGMHNLYVDSSQALPQSYYESSRPTGLSVRCIAIDNTERTISQMTMQEIGKMNSTNYNALFNSMEDGKSYNTTDERDGKIYTIAKINNNLWMTQNLRYIGDTGSNSGSMVMKSTTSNIDTDTTITYYNLETDGATGNQKCYGIDNNNGGYYYPCIKDSTNHSYGVYYNYASATANTIAGYNNSTNATYDVCPKGWRLPTSVEQGTIGSSSGSTAYVSAWLPVYAGIYRNASLMGASTNGSWWSSTPYVNTMRRYMYYDSGELRSESTVERYYGLSIRCIRAGATPICFPAGTEVTVSMDGATKPIEEIREGDEVVSYDPNTGEYYMTEVVGTIVHDGNESATRLAEMVLDDNTKLEMTENHPVLTKDGYKAMNNKEYPTLTKDDIIITTTGERAIKSIEMKDVEPTVVYNLNVKGRDGDTEDGPTHSYIANGVVVHNVVVCGN